MLDFCIHVMTKEITERELRIHYNNHMSHKWYEFDYEKRKNTADDWHDKILKNYIFIGEYSWGSAHPVAALISWMIDDGVTIIDDCFLNLVEEYYNRLETMESDFKLNSKENVMVFLKKWKNYKIFTIEW